MLPLVIYIPIRLLGYHKQAPMWITFPAACSLLGPIPALAGGAVLAVGWVVFRQMKAEYANKNPLEVLALHWDKSLFILLAVPPIAVVAFAGFHLWEWRNFEDEPNNLGALDELLVQRSLDARTQKRKRKRIRRRTGQTVLVGGVIKGHSRPCRGIQYATNACRLVARFANAFLLVVGG